MAIEDDVCVIGGGLAGLLSALAAAECGASVRLISHKNSTLGQASGLIDLLGYTPSGEIVAEPYDAIARLPEAHPYRRLGVDTVRDGMALFDRSVGDSYCGDHTTANALVPTYGGTVKPTARYPAMTAAGIASDDAPVALVGFDRFTAYSAPLVAAQLEAAGSPSPIRGETVSVPGEFRTDARRHRLVRALDANERIQTAHGSRRIRAALAETIAETLQGEPRVGLPAVLGRTDFTGVRRDLEAALGAAVFELPMGPPSVPGERLEAQLFEALDAAGVRQTIGTPVVDFDADGSQIQTVYTDRNGTRVPYAADQFVLATGGLVGKGIDSSRSGVREPVFDCHVAQPSDRSSWYESSPFSRQPFATFGVTIDDQCRPLDASGQPEFANLSAAGSVLAGTDSAIEKSASGVSIASGFRAGRRAGKQST